MTLNGESRHYARGSKTGYSQFQAAARARMTIAGEISLGKFKKNVFKTAGYEKYPKNLKFNRT